MTNKEMEREIRIRTGLPLDAIQLVLEAQKGAIREALYRQEDIKFLSLFRIRASLREKALRDPRRGTSYKVKMLVLSIKPSRRFRKELNQWTSTES